MTDASLAPGSYLGFSMLVLLLVVGCSTQSIKMIDPQSGATAECSASGFAVGISIADGVVGACSRTYEARGYVILDQLQPDERASLERRGLLPKNH